ncbi:hypothetical protein [Bartonella rattaustraliani]|uniref:hypothetical protein n=1 Tax=Bartonella rattaustraliani TaxID=481139 RepID=UPI0002D5CC4D|nr:hypothetical protein [Bartonella rattaustraliani]
MPVLYFHKHKDGGARWLYPYTIHGRQRKMGLGALRDTLKQTHEHTNPAYSIKTSEQS